MTANELRIGNLVTAKSPERQEWESPVVVTIGYLEMFTTDKVHFKPLPLTEEWLLKFGFEKVKSDHEEAETWDFYFGILYFDMANNSVKINGQYCLSNIPEHVHQLQNLYFALTREELTIKSE